MKVSSLPQQGSQFALDVSNALFQSLKKEVKDSGIVRTVGRVGKGVIFGYLRGYLGWANAVYSPVSVLSQPNDIYQSFWHDKPFIKILPDLHRMWRYNWRNKFLFGAVAAAIFIPAWNLSGMDYSEALHLPSLKGRVYSEGLLILAAAIRSGLTFYEGIQYMNAVRSRNKKINTSSKVYHFVSSLMLMYYGANGLQSALASGANFMLSRRKFHTLDEMNQEEVLKYRAIHTLTTEKKCQTAIIRADDPSKMSFNYGLYEHCNVKVYREPKNAKEFCLALSNATDNFRDPLDVLAIEGHGTCFGNDQFASCISLSPNYCWYATPEELNCVEKAIHHKTGQVYLLGCETAFHLSPKVAAGLPNERVIQNGELLVPGIRVYGYSNIANPGFSMARYKEGRIVHDLWDEKISWYKRRGSFLLGNVFKEKIQSLEKRQNMECYLPP